MHEEVLADFILGRSTAEQLARDLAQRPFVSPPTSTSTHWANAGYDAYRDIRFRRERAIWHGEGRNFELQLLPAAWLYKFPVSINIVAGGKSRPIAPDNGFFAFGRLAGNPDVNEPPIDLSGFRINGPINHPGVFDEIVVCAIPAVLPAATRTLIAPPPSATL